MKISEAIEKLEAIKNRFGDLRLYMEVSEEIPCKSCDNTVTETHDGYCKFIDSINLSNEKHVWLLAEQI